MNGLTAVEAREVDTAKTLTHKFISRAPTSLNGINLVYNDQMMYPRNLTNTTTISSMAFNAQGGPLYIPIQQQRLGIDSHQTATVSSNVSKEIDGQLNFMCFKLNKNKLINSKGIEYVQNLEFDDDTINRVYMQIRKYFVIQDGFLTCYYDTDANDFQQ